MNIVWKINIAAWILAIAVLTLYPERPRAQAGCTYQQIGQLLYINCPGERSATETRVTAEP